MVTNRTLKNDWKVILYSGFILAGFGLFWYWSSTTQNESIEPTRKPEVNILFSGQSYPLYDALEPAIQQASLLDWDAIVFGGNTADLASGQQIDKIADAASNFSNNVALLPGPKDSEDQYFSNNNNYRYFNTGPVQHILLDTTQSDDCNFPSEQIELLKEALSKPADHRVLYTHHSWWVKPAQTPKVISFLPELECEQSRWFEEIQPLLKDKVDIVISANGSTLLSDTFNNVRYIITGARTKDPNNFLPFVRISLLDDQLLVDKFEIADQNQINTAKLDKLPTYQVEVDPAEFHDLYQQLPIYDFQKYRWEDLLEDKDGAGAEPLKGKISNNGDTYNGSISTRGSLGNHWEGLKKSWTLEWDLEDGSQKQLKFIMPTDRLYINQLFVQEVNSLDELNVISPRQSVARLFINGIDFGPYLTYEDFDKVFIEQSQFGSDTDRAGGKFRDLFAFYPAWDDLNNIDKSGPNLPKEDKSWYQKALLFNGDFTDFENYIDPGNYRDWIASQIFTGDFHQNANNNMRYFMDRSTGKYIFLSWDQFYGQMRSVDDFILLHANSDLQFAILADPEEKAAIYKTVRELLKKESYLQGKIDQLEDEYLEVFLNDPFPLHTTGEIKQKIGILQERFDNNMPILKKAFR